MVHTFEIIRQLNIDELNELIATFNPCEYSIQRFFDLQRHCGIIKIPISRCYPEYGIKCLLLIRYSDGITTNYYAVLRIEPQIMLMRTRTISLFYCSNENVRLLTERFGEIISDIFPDICSCMATLSSWNCRRIDYSANLRFENASLARLFLDLSKKTSRYVRKTLKRVRGVRQQEQSTAEGNGSVKTTIYDKQRQINHCYNHIPLSEQRRLECEAVGIIRFEVQCQKTKVQTLKRKYGFSDRSIVNYLQEYIAVALLFNEYDNVIGRGNFYSRYHAEKIINASTLSANKKQKLLLLLMLIAKTRHVSEAKRRFIDGTTVRHKGEDIPLQGSVNTFRAYLSDLATLGINPVLIPKERRITTLKNPRQQIIFHIV